ncbi:MAG TPA: SRPBCC family protein [Acidimicrobiia bacterium]|nr:SRPBCC family protein [Acidimicrobiia bacterium]
MQFLNAVDIERPIEEVFAYLADFENIPDWNYAIVETQKTSEGPVGIGSTYRQVRSLPSRSEETFEVTDYRSHQSLTISGTMGPFIGDLKYRLESTARGTRVTNEVDLQPRGMVGLVGQLAGSRVKEAVATNLNELKRILESRSTGKE